MKSKAKSKKPSRLSKLSLKIRSRRFKAIVIGLAALVLTLLLVRKFSVIELRSRSEAPLTRGAFILQSFKWEDKDSKYAMVKPGKNEHYITVSLEIKHTLPYDAWFTPGIESYVKDSSGKKHGIEMVITDHPFNSTSYKPNELASGSLAYNVPTEDKTLEWCYHFSSNQQTNEDLCVPLNTYNRSKL